MVIVVIRDKLHGLLVDAVSGILTVAPDDVAKVQIGYIRAGFRLT